MFDDVTPKNLGQVPQNLPMGEPEDMFAGAADDDVVPSDVLPSAGANKAEPSTLPTALNAGILKPKIEASTFPISAPAAQTAQNIPPSVTTASIIPTTAAPNTPTIPSYAGQQAQPLNEGREVETMTGPMGSRHGLRWAIIATVIIILGVGSVVIYYSFVKEKTVFPEDASSSDLTPNELNNLAPVDNLAPKSIEPESISQEPLPAVETTVATPTTSVDEKLLFGVPVDTDGDGLDDVREGDLKTEYLNWDTDGDDLSDGDEVIVWKTNPLDPDTDKDSFADGTEVKNGYSPTGAGKLFAPLSVTTTPS